jgi:hypothetical protein
LIFAQKLRPKTINQIDPRGHSENGRARELIKTIVDDALYPWPAGKEPWSVEQGIHFMNTRFG